MSNPLEGFNGIPDREVADTLSETFDASIQEEPLASDRDVVTLAPRLAGVHA